MEKEAKKSKKYRRLVIKQLIIEMTRDEELTFRFRLERALTSDFHATSSLSREQASLLGFLPHGAVEWTTQLRENKDDDWCDDDDDDDDDDCLSMRVFVVVLDEREKREEKW